MMMGELLNDIWLVKKYQVFTIANQIVRYAQGFQYRITWWVVDNSFRLRQKYKLKCRNIHQNGKPTTISWRYTFQRCQFTKLSTNYRSKLFRFCALQRVDRRSFVDRINSVFRIVPVFVKLSCVATLFDCSWYGKFGFSCRKIIQLQFCEIRFEK